MEKYIDRHEAGKILAIQLREYANKPNIIVLALPRGGVPVAYEIANYLSLPLDIFVVRKLGVPYHEEFAMGAIATGDTLIFNDEIIKKLNIPQYAIEAVIQAEKDELKRREIKYRGNRPFPQLTGKIIILVDDGIATGASMGVAIQALRKYNPASIIIAVPVAPLSGCETLGKMADKLICPSKPEPFYAVGQWYQNFSQVSDEEVYELLKNHQK